MEKGCRNCLWLYSMVSHIPTAPCYECLDYNKWQTTKPTNADRIRSMTDEELAKFISGKARTFGEEYEGYMSALDWLRQEGE